METGPALLGLQVLVAEDDFIIAMDIVRTLAAAGAEVVGPVHSETDAMSALDRTIPDLAVLDVDLGPTGPQFAVAHRLCALSVPFVIITGYDREDVPLNLQVFPVLLKPADVEWLVPALASLSTR